MQIAPMAPRVLQERTIERLRAAVGAAGSDWSYVSALSGSGPVAEFEKACRQTLRVRHALALSSGTAALFVALHAVGVRPGDEVVVPAYSWPQTAAPVIHLGAVPIAADIDAERYTIDPRSVARCLTARTRAIIAVHLYGQPADMRTVCKLAHDRNLFVIEDCAQAFGASIAGRSVGNWGHIGCFSLGREKPLTGGEGGLLVTNRRAVYERALALSQHPIRLHYETGGCRLTEFGDFGFNFRPHPLALVIALSELRSNEKRRRCRAAFYQRLSEQLGGVPGIRPPVTMPACDHAWYRYCPTYVASELADGRLPRDTYIQALVAEGVPLYADPVGVPLHRRPGFRWAARRFPRCPAAAERCFRSGLALASWVAEQGDDGLITVIRAAFEKVAAAADDLAEHPDRCALLVLSSATDLLCTPPGRMRERKEWKTAHRYSQRR